MEQKRVAIVGGEVLDVDGVTGGFSFQAAWTTAYTVVGVIAAAQQKNSTRFGSKNA